MLGESYWPMLCQWESLAGEFQVRLESLGLKFPFCFVAKSFILVLALLTLQVASGSEKSFVLLAGETNRNGCIKETTLDFHTDRFSFFFFFLSLMRFQERVRESG